MKISTAKKKCAACKTKAKVKVAEKVGKKCAKACVLLAVIALFAGCQQVPSRSQTLTLRDCVVNVYGCGPLTNECATVEIGTQAMSVENSGTETLTPSQTTDTKPDVDVTVGGKASAGGLLETLASKLTGSSSSDTATTATTAATGDCSDGSCTYNQ